MSKIHIEGLYKAYGNRTARIPALENVNLSIEQNEFVTLVGPSGCGKSTLLKLIAALAPPTRGKLLFDGAQLMRPTRDIGIVFQEPVLLQWRTVLDNVLLPTEIFWTQQGHIARTRDGADQPGGARRVRETLSP